MATTSAPKLSIVTVNLNNAAGLKRTIDSVSAQTGAEIEYIVVDGGSSDSSVEILRQRNADIDSWVSEPDTGIYAAMNKGIAAASGEFICFMNSGDAFAPAVLERLLDRYSEWRDYDVVYGDILNATSAKIERAGNPTSIFRDMPFRHQAAIVRTELHKRFPFDTRYRVAADYDFMLRSYLDGRRFFPTEICLGEYDAGGISNNQYFTTIGEYVRILWRRHRGLRRVARVGGYLWGKKKFISYLLVRRVLGDENYSAVIGRLRRADSVNR
jgi:glycosyltransferase involved in cell wall biosynthesis